MVLSDARITWGSIAEPSQVLLSFLFKLTALSDWGRYYASELTRTSPLTSLIGKHLTDLWLYTLEFQDSLSIPEVRETWERERALLHQAIFLHLACWDSLGLALNSDKIIL